MVADTVTLDVASYSGSTEPPPSYHLPERNVLAKNFRLVRTFICSTSFTIYGHNLEGIYICTDQSKERPARRWALGGVVVVVDGWIRGPKWE